MSARISRRAERARRRRYGERVQRRAEAVVSVVAELQALTTRPLTAGEVGAEVRARLGGRWEGRKWSFPRDWEPAIASEALIASRIGRQTYLSIPGAKANPPQVWGTSLLACLEEGLRRAVERSGHAVPPSAVAAVCASDTDLREFLGGRAVVNHFESLVRTGRASALRFPGRVAGTHFYYTVPGGPTTVDPEMAATMDRRWAVLVGAWRGAGGRPVTTAAVRRWAARKHAGWFAGNPAYAWTNALQWLWRTDELSKIVTPGVREVRWAPRKEWEALSAKERAARLHDEWRDESEFVSSPGEEPDNGAGPRAIPRRRRGISARHDPGFRSAAQNLQSLLRITRQIRVEACANPEERELLSARPLGMSELVEAARANPHLIPKGVDIQALIREAARMRNGCRRRPLTGIGTVGRETYYDTASSGPAVAYVNWLRAIWDASQETVWRVTTLHWEALALNAAGRLPAARGLLEENAATYRSLIERHRTAIRVTAASALLTSTERAETDAMLSRLSGLAAMLSAGGSSLNATVEARDDLSRLPRECLLDPRLAHEQVKAVRPGGRSGGTLAWELKIATVPITVEPAVGRKTLKFLDRVAFAAAAMERWGSVFLQRYAALGRLTLGPIRNAARLVEMLERNEERANAPGIIAGLGLIDDRAARSAVVAYAMRLIENWDPYVPPIQVQLAIVFALSRKPAGGLATSLGSDEDAVLRVCESRSQSPQVQQLASAVLRGWHEGTHSGQGWLV